MHEGMHKGMSNDVVGIEMKHSRQGMRAIYYMMDLIT